MRRHCTISLTTHLLVICSILNLHHLLLATAHVTHPDDHPRHFTNRWAMEVRGGEHLAHAVAHDHGFHYFGHIYDDFYSMRHPKVSSKSKDTHEILSAALTKDKRVSWFEQQVSGERVGRASTKPYSDPSDPSYKKQWYHFEKAENMNIEQTWKNGYTGKDVVVAIVDDGVWYNNSDILPNYYRAGSFDSLDNDTDPSPYSPQNYHGTRCAGVVGAAANNGFCGVGTAPDVRLAAIRIRSPEFTDDAEGRGLAVMRSVVDIFSCSYGPIDSGYKMGGMGPMARGALEAGVKHGRRGKGNIFVWSSGNGGVSFDSCAYDGYVNNIRTISVAAIGKHGNALYGGEKCSANMVTAYSKDGGDHNYPIVSTDYGDHGCTDEFSGTSAAAPMVSGSIALALQANKDLTWRDVQHLIALSSDNKMEVKENDWITNGAGYKVSSSWGFGLLDACTLTEFARYWTGVSEQRTCTMRYSGGVVATPGPARMKMSEQTCAEDIKYVEHIEVYVNASFCVRGFLRLTVESPLGTRSVVLPGRLADYRSQRLDWTTMSVQFWGENPSGIWKFNFENLSNDKKHSGCTGRVKDLRLILHGTNRDPRSSITEEQEKQARGMCGKYKPVLYSGLAWWEVLLILIVLLFIVFVIMVIVLARCGCLVSLPIPKKFKTVLGLSTKQDKAPPLPPRRIEEVRPLHDGIICNNHRTLRMRSRESEDDPLVDPAPPPPPPPEPTNNNADIEVSPYDMVRQSDSENSLSSNSFYDNIRPPGPGPFRSPARRAQDTFDSESQDGHRNSMDTLPYYQSQFSQDTFRSRTPTTEGDRSSITSRPSHCRQHSHEVQISPQISQQSEPDYNEVSLGNRSMHSSHSGPSSHHSRHSAEERPGSGASMARSSHSHSPTSRTPPYPIYATVHKVEPPHFANSYHHDDSYTLNELPEQHSPESSLLQCEVMNHTTPDRVSPMLHNCGVHA